MHVSFATTLVVTALVASIVLVLHRGDRLFPVVAAVASGIEALIAFRLIELSSGKLRIDVILPAVLLVAGGISWSKSSTRPTITAATVVTLIAAIQLFAALHVLR